MQVVKCSDDANSNFVVQRQCSPIPKKVENFDHKSCMEGTVTRSLTGILCPSNRARLALFNPNQIMQPNNPLNHPAPPRHHRK